MKLLAIALFLTSLISVYAGSDFICSDGVPLEKKIIPARKGDEKGFQKLVTSFMAAVVGGLPNDNVPSLDPLKIPSFETCLEDFGASFHFRDLVIRNLSNVDIYHAILDTKENTTEIQLKLHLRMTANVAIRLNNKEDSTDFKSLLAAPARLLKSVLDKIFIGYIDLHLNTNELPCTTKYGFSATPDKNGVTYFTVLDNVSKCKMIHDAVLRFSPSLNYFFQDEDLNNCDVSFDPEDQTWKNQLTIKLVKLVIDRLIDNFRIACRIMPAYKYIPDIDC